MVKCRYHEICGREGGEGTEKDLCILHSQGPAKDEKAFGEALAEHRAKRGDDFRSFVFPVPVDFRKEQFANGARFSDATFNFRAYFDDATFDGPVDFGGARFVEDVFFRSAKFDQGARFANTKFTKEADFFGATFSGQAEFRRVKFSDETDFRHAKFIQTADFREAKFTGAAKFSGSEFLREANLQNASFANEADFSGVEFFGNADFSGIHFNEKANFHGAAFTPRGDAITAMLPVAASFERAKFSKEAIFSQTSFTKPVGFGFVNFGKAVDFFGAEFADKAGFIGATFGEQVNFHGVTFAEEVNFRWAKFTKEVYFIGTRFAIKASFSEASFLGRSLFCRSADDGDSRPIFSGAEIDFRWVIIKPLDALILRDADLERCQFLGTDLRSAEISNAKWPRVPNRLRLHSRDTSIRRFLDPANWPLTRRLFGTRFGVYDELLLIREGERSSLPHIERLYRELKQNYEDRRDYGRAGEFHYGEKEMRRKNPETRWDLRHLLFLYRLVSGYGERFWPPLLWAAILLAVSTFLYLCFGLLRVNKDAGLVLDFSNVCDAALYSLRVTTLLKPDEFVPVGLCGTIVCTAQSILGPLLIGLFALALRQQLKR